MPRIDPIDRINVRVDFSKMKEQLRAKLAFYEQAAAEVKRELDAISIIEQSKHLASKNEDKPQPNLFSKPTIRDRMMATIATMPEKFTRNELFEAIKNDGKGDVNAGSLSVFFPQLKEEGYIAELEKAHGGYPGYYTKGSRIR